MQSSRRRSLDCGDGDDLRLLRPDILPLGDIGVVRTMERLYAEGERLDAPALEAIAQPWRPFRTVAVWYLWRSLDPEPVEY